MNARLHEAIAILGDIDADDASTEARGRRAHAARAAVRRCRHRRYANLLTLAQLGKKDSQSALNEARRLLAADEEPAKLKGAA